MDEFLSKSCTTPYEAELHEGGEVADIYARKEQPLQEAQVSAPFENSPVVRTSGRFCNNPDRYEFPPVVLHITARKGLLQYSDKTHDSS